MDYRVSILPIPDDAPKQKIDLDSNIITLMSEFQLGKNHEEWDVKNEDRHAYDHKINLYFLFTPHENHSLIDTFTSEQLSLLHKQRYFQRLRKHINYVLSTEIGTINMKETTFEQLRETMNAKFNRSYGYEFTDIDTVKFVKDAFKLIEEI
jgi:hypothetical protein